MSESFEVLKNELNKHGIMLATAESCTGGLIAAGITDLAGSSSVFDRGFVTYSNESKEELLGVSHEILENYGAVSAETAQAMVQGALTHSRAGIAVSVTGIAGPGGGSAEKPVGLVYIGWGKRGENAQVQRYLFSGNRAQIRKQTQQTAVQHLIDYLRDA